MIRKSAILLLVAAVISACSTVVKVQNNKDTGVILVGSGDPDWDRLDKLLKDNEAFKNDRNEALDKSIKSACTKDEITPQFAPLALLAPIVINFVMSQVDKALQEELKNYTAAYGAQNSTANFYLGVKRDSDEDRENNSGEIRADHIVPQFSCIRFWREVKDENEEDTKEIVMDFVVALRMTKRRDGIQIQPLRLFLSQPVAKYDGVVAVSIAMKGSSVWRDNSVGRSATIFDLTVLTQKFTLAGSERDTVKYPFKEDEPKIELKYSGDAWKGIRIWPMVPWSSGQSTEVDRGNLNYEVTVAEVGKVPFGLEAIAGIISKNKGKIAGELEKAVGELLSDE